MDDKASARWYPDTRQGDVLGGGCGHPHNFDCLADRIQHLVEQGNHWWELQNNIAVKGEREEYVDGNIQYTFEFARADLNAQLVWRDRVICPFQGGQFRHHHFHTPLTIGACGINGLQPFGGNRGLIYRWEQQPVFVDDVEFMNHEKNYVRSVIAKNIPAGCQSSHRTIEPRTCTMGHSLLNGGVKQICFGAKGELDVALVSDSRAVGGDNLPISMVQCGSEVVNCVATRDSDKLHNGFVFFTPKGALAGLCICFEDEGERSFFAEQFVKIVDVFRSLANLKNCAV